MISKNEIGKYIPLYLSENNMSVQVFADNIRASKSAVYAWINGTNRPLEIYYKKLLELLEPYFSK